LATICCSGDIVKSIIAKKVEDNATPEKRLSCLKFVVSFDGISAEDEENS